jgi:hypothetical protein
MRAPSSSPPPTTIATATKRKVETHLGVTIPGDSAPMTAKMKMMKTTR